MPYIICSILLAVGFEPVQASLTFEKDIRPILRAHCYDCHGSVKELKGSLDLRLVRFMKRGGKSGPVVVPGQPEKSFLLKRIRAGEMPPGDGHVSPKEMAIIEAWIRQGAVTARPEPESIGQGLGITDEERGFWAYQLIRRPSIPSQYMQPRSRTAIDALIRSRMPEGLDFSPDADRLTIIRRLSLDLTGIPPTLDQIDQFVNDTAVDAYEQLVERLLDSPRYGERWARHWLDAAGYADSEGYDNKDTVRPYAYKYRNYVIGALNDDKPFDRFVTEQLAGDELAGQKNGEWTSKQIELLTATGFLRMAVDGTASGGIDQNLARNQTIADTIKIVSSSLLALSVGCAQCHDHRYDPISQKDYYRLRAIFEPGLNWKSWLNPNQRRISLYTAEDRARAAEAERAAQTIMAEKSKKQSEYLDAALEKQLLKHNEPLRAELRSAYKTVAKDRTEDQKALLKKYPSINISPGVLYQYNQAAADDLKKYDQRVSEARSKKPVEEFVRALTEPSSTPPETYLFHRGDHRQPTDKISPGVLSVLWSDKAESPIPENQTSIPTSGRRLAYAKWLTNGRHPLLARVTVNRVWMHYFGKGIVETAGDFGRLGQLPTHPELLDWLASEFMSGGWSLKRIHRSIVTSTVYRQSSQASQLSLERDPSNEYLSRMRVRRLDAETIRDRFLSVSGSLVSSHLLGQVVPVTLDDAGQARVLDDSRRSIYVQARRSQPVSFLTTFDAPVMETNCDRRTSSTVATQSLMMLNGDLVLRQAALLADRVLAECKDVPVPKWRLKVSERIKDKSETGIEPQVALLWHIGLGRSITREEIDMVDSFLIAQLESAELPAKIEVRKSLLTHLSQMILSSNEFLYVD